MTVLVVQFFGTAKGRSLVTEKSPTRHPAPCSNPSSCSMSQPVILSGAKDLKCQRAKSPPSRQRRSWTPNLPPSKRKGLPHKIPGFFAFILNEIQPERDCPGLADGTMGSLKQLPQLSSLFLLAPLSTTRAWVARLNPHPTERSFVPLIPACYIAWSGNDKHIQEI